MSEDKNTKINDEVVLSESEKQERILREQFKIKKRNRRIRKLVIWAVVILVLMLGLSWYMQLRENMRAEQEAMMARSSQVQAKVTRNVFFGPEGTQSLPMTQGVWGNGVVVQETCRQCAHPVPCANACPQGAIRVDPKTGARKVDTKLCIGCHLCEKACPWGMMSFDVEEEKASKCFLCDGDPKCVKACPAAAIRYIPWIDRTEDRPRRTTHGYYAQENNAQCSICHR